jgi:sugar lactone lactonase YvrE
MRKGALLVSLALILGSWVNLARADDSAVSQGTIFASSNQLPDLQYPETVITDKDLVYVTTYNTVDANNNHIYVFDKKGKLLNDIGATSNQQKYFTAGLLGLAIEPKTGDLYVAANGTGNILRIQNPDKPNPKISIYSTYPSGGGPEDMEFDRFGTLYANDSNLGVVYTIPPGGGTPQLLIGPPGSGAPVSDEGLLQSPVAGLSPNGIGFSPDGKKLYLTNTYSDSVIAFDVNNKGIVTGKPQVLAQNLNDDLEEYPTGFDALVLPDTKIGPSASTPLNGPDGLRVDKDGKIYVSSIFGDNITVLSPNGKILGTYGTSAVTSNGLLNSPTSVDFEGNQVLVTNLALFTGLAGEQRPFTVISFDKKKDLQEIQR